MPLQCLNIAVKQTNFHPLFYKYTVILVGYELTCQYTCNIGIIMLITVNALCMYMYMYILITDSVCGILGKQD